jgi:hypothetical protein
MRLGDDDDVERAVVAHSPTAFVDEARVVATDGAQRWHREMASGDDTGSRSLLLHRWQK